MIRPGLHRPEPTEGLPTPAHAAPATLLLSARDAARLLAVSVRTLWGLTDSGEVQCVRIGRAVRYAVADLEAFVERPRQEQAAQAGGRPR